MEKLVQDIHERKPNYDFGILAQAEICEDENDMFSQERFDILKSKKSALPYGTLIYFCRGNKMKQVFYFSFIYRSSVN